MDKKRTCENCKSQEVCYRYEALRNVLFENFEEGICNNPKTLDEASEEIYSLAANCCSYYEFKKGGD